MTKSKLIDLLARRQAHLARKDVELAVKCIIDTLSRYLATGQRIEIRGFASFFLRYRSPRSGRNPKTGDMVDLTPKYTPYFKSGKALRGRVDEGRGI